MLFKNIISAKNIMILWIVCICTFLGSVMVTSCTKSIRTLEISGFVKSGKNSIPFSTIKLFSTGNEHGVQVLGTAKSKKNGFFKISYPAPIDPNTVLYLTAEGHSLNAGKFTKSTIAHPVKLALMLGRNFINRNVIINERTTVATAFSMAQFFTEKGIDGTYPGLQNAADISHNLADPKTGDVAKMLDSIPNGFSTTTRATFNSLANMLGVCININAHCNELFTLSTPPAGTAPQNTFEAVLNIAHYPSQNLEALLAFSKKQNLYTPALSNTKNTTAWILALRYVGNGHEFNGPGNIAFDKEGNAWIANNYTFDLKPLDPTGKVCGDTHLLSLTPTGQDLPGAPYQGGGVYGAGYGITFDPNGNVWVGNFGFQGSNCLLNLQARSKSVSKFSAQGAALSPNTLGNSLGGFMGAGNSINQPQGTVSDLEGNIWIANCSGRSITQFPNGDPNRAFNIKPIDNLGNNLLIRPFDIAIDINGNAWVSSNGTNSLYHFDKKGNILHSLSGSAAETAGINLPMGVATDTLGNVWVSNSGIVRIACDNQDFPGFFEIVALTLDPNFNGKNASVTMINANGKATGPFKGAGLLVPWGMAIDGNNNVWASNFQGQRISQLCGAQPENCPPGAQTGDPISPEEGYFFDGLTRSTAVSVDPSGNVWATNNWEVFANQENPGGNAVVVFIGLAKPIKTPLIQTNLSPTS